MELKPHSPREYRYFMHIPGGRRGGAILHITRHSTSEPRITEFSTLKDRSGRTTRYRRVLYDDLNNKVITLYHGRPGARGLNRVGIRSEDLEHESKLEEGLPLFDGGRIIHMEPSAPREILKTVANHVAKAVGLNSSERDELINKLDREASSTWGHF